MAERVFWTYTELTESAEKEIALNMAEARSTRDVEERKRNQQYATGVLMGWLAVVGSSALEADRERLKKKVLLHG